MFKMKTKYNECELEKSNSIKIKTLEDLKNLSSKDLRQLNLSKKIVENIIEDIKLRTKNIDMLLFKFEIEKSLYDEDKETYNDIEGLNELMFEIDLESELDFLGVFDKLHKSKLEELEINCIDDYEYIKIRTKLDNLSFYDILDEVKERIENE